MKCPDKNNIFSYIKFDGNEKIFITIKFHPVLQTSKAFDKVWHDSIICKLKQNGISDNILNLSFNFLRNRKQRVVLNDQTSSLTDINA